MRKPIACDRTQLEQALAHGDLSLDHPIHGTAVEQFLRALRRHPRDVHDVARAALLLAFGRALLLPIREIGNAFGANGQFDEMERHEETLDASNSGINHVENLPTHQTEAVSFEAHGFDFGNISGWCGREESNLHELPH